VRLLRFRSPSSLRARLALWYLLVLALVLVIFGGVVFWDVRHSLLDGVDAALSSHATTVLGQVDVGSRGVGYRGASAVNADIEIAVYLFDRHGTLRRRVFGERDLPPQPHLLSLALRGREGYATLGNTRLYMAGILDRQGRPAGAVQAIQSLDGVRDTLRELLTLLLLAIPTLLAVATAGGVFLAGRALAPIDHIARTARRIEAGNLAGRLGSSPRDDEVGRLAATFDGMLDRLEHSFAQQRQFVADASHELRTPLAVVRSDLDILRRRPRSVAEHEDFARDLDEEIARLSALVDDLLTLARADSGQAELAWELVYLDVVVDHVAQGLRRLGAAQGVAIETHLEREVAVMGDPVRLRQLVVNIVGNAVKYTPVGGQVRVTLTGQGSAASLEVSDTGIGIAPDDIPSIFDRFYRADRARTRAEGDTGLGLSIARWCAEAHGGRITVRSALGVGSTFVVTLPLVSSDEPAPLSARWAAETALNS